MVATYSDFLFFFHLYLAVQTIVYIFLINFFILYNITHFQRDLNKYVSPHPSFPLLGSDNICEQNELTLE